MALVALRDIVQRNDIPAGRRFDLCVQALIVVSLISFSVETLPDLPSRTQRALDAIEIVTVSVFTAEYLLRLAFARRKLRYVFSFYGLIDLAAILPFYLTTVLPAVLPIATRSHVDLRALRVLRLLRLFRALKLVRYNQAIQRFRRALVMVKEELILFFSTTVLLLYVAGVGIYYFERQKQPDVFRSVFDGLWWAVATLTTVGYGDIYPKTAGGRLFTFAVLMIGLGMVAVPTGIIASALANARDVDEGSSRAA